jgi:polar amino acid transport system substrate-binding protein
MLKKKFLALLAVLAGVLAVSLPVAAQDEPALPDLGGRTVTVAIENAYIPFNYIDQETGEAVGWDYDALAEICARLNCVPEFIETSWDGMINAVANGEFDMAADGITITPERAEIVDFSVGYISIIQRMLVRKDETRFATVEEFVANPELKIGVQNGTTNFLTAQELVGDDRLVVITDFGAIIQALVSGDIDAQIADDVAGQGYVGENADALTMLPEELASDELGFIFAKGSELTEPFNVAIESMKADGTLAKINAKWFPSVLPDLGGRTITIAVENAYQPFNFIDEATGEAVGWDYDTVNEICARLNCVPEYVETSWDGMINAVANGEFDVAADGITITEERAEIVDFSQGYISVIQRMMVRADEDRFTNVEEFVANPELRIGTQTGTTNYITAQELVGDDRLVVTPDFGSAIQALIAGDIDAVLIDDTAGQGYVGENAEDLKLLSDDLSSDQLGFIFPKGSDLVAAFNAALSAMEADGTLAAINAVWFPPTE